MQNKGVIKFFAITFILVCLFQLSFTFISYRYANKADEYANAPAAKSMAEKMSQGDPLKLEYYYDSISKARLEYYNDSMANVDVYNILLKKYTLKDVREREINLGLDLKGGMNVTMAVSVPDVIRALSGYNQDPTFKKALQLAIDKEKRVRETSSTFFMNHLKRPIPMPSWPQSSTPLNSKTRSTTTAQMMKSSR